jgi:LPLT family lysophospholipid transporter-like MFS transporter
LKNMHKLLLSQFLSALADNAILMATLNIITSKALGAAYMGIVQASFFVAYIILAPYASVLSERIPKSNVLMWGNAFKLIGVVMLALYLDPALAYAVVGIGACIYSPGKYGILRELTKSSDELYKANGLVEGSTIVAILIGTVLGGFLSTYSITLLLIVIALSYVVSWLLAIWLPKGTVSEVSFKGAWKIFFVDIKSLWVIPEVKISLLGTSSFWMSSAVLRLGMLAWIPIALHLVGEDKASLFMGVSAVGIMFGAIASPKLIPLTKQRIAFAFGIAMALVIMLVGFIPQMYVTGALLFFAGFLGGTYVIPLNTTLQEKGKHVGSGKVIAIQNFFENFAMVAGTLVYTQLVHMSIGIPYILLGMGAVLVILMYKLSLMQGRLK